MSRTWTPVLRGFATFASFEDETQDKGCWTKERVGSARFSASSSAGGHDGNQEGSVEASAHDRGEADRFSGVKAASCDLPNVSERYALFFAPMVAAPATHKRIVHERRLLDHNPRAIGPGDAQLRRLASR